MQSIAGYVVIAPSNGPLELVKGEEYGARGVLFSGTRVTVFKTRQSARAAIKRTRQYAADKGYTDPWWTQHSIKSVARGRV